MENDPQKVALQPWAEEDLPLLQCLMSDPRVMSHLGGPETPDQILSRHRRYMHLPDDGIDHMFKIVLPPGSTAVGSIGYWRKIWREQPVYEAGWMILPGFQGRGIATHAARAVIEHAGREARYRYLHAFPAVSNAASNAICRRLGFSLIEECRFEYPPGSFMQANNWRLDLFEG